MTSFRLPASALFEYDAIAERGYRASTRPKPQRPDRSWIRPILETDYSRIFKRAVANESYAVSVGSSTVKRRILNVADGVDANDVTTVGQLAALEDLVAKLEERIAYLESLPNNMKKGKKDK